MKKHLGTFFQEAVKTKLTVQFSKFYAYSISYSGLPMRVYKIWNLKICISQVPKIWNYYGL